MKISAGLILRDELDRYLGPVIEHLLEFVDEIRVVDDGSTDGWEEALRPTWGDDGKRVLVEKWERSGTDAFLSHAKARNRLLQFTLEGNPDWVIASDCDEIWTDGPALRAACEAARVDVLTVDIAEVWEACDDVLCTREDGGWRTHPIGAVWRASRFRRQALALTDKQTATGRVPDAVHRVPSRPSGVGLLHFGWANEAERGERFKRYPTGSGHANQHVESIMWTDARVKLSAIEWPTMPAERQAAILERASRA